MFLKSININCKYINLYLSFLKEYIHIKFYDINKDTKEKLKTINL
jgi:hypothetical protein